MRVSTRLDYGVRAMIDLALREGRSPVQSRDIATSQDIPEPYLNQLLTVLRKGGLIVSRRGPGGGHQLARASATIPLAEIVGVLEGPLDVVLDDADPGARSSCGRALGDVWREVGDQLRRTLESVTLADLAARARGRTPSYQI